MYLKLFGIVVILQAYSTSTDTKLGVGNDAKDATLIYVTKSAAFLKVKDCDISNKYIDIAQVDRSHIQDASVEQIIKQLNDTLYGNYKTIYDIITKSKCNFPYVQRGLKNVQQRIVDIIEIFSCSEQRKDKDRLNAAVDLFVSAKDCMIADMRAASKSLTQECADLFTKIRPAACNTGENVIFAVLNSLDK